MRSVTFGVAASVLLWVPLVLGCGSSGDNPVATAGGTVTLNGQPVSNLVVTLTPIATGDDGLPGKSASGITDESGQFTLSTYEIGDGAVVGEHRVGIGMNGPQATPPGKLPADYTLEVKQGANDFSIELTK